jgi:hypothetical protein
MRAHAWADVCVLYTAKKHGPHTHVWAGLCFLLPCPGGPEAYSAHARHDIVIEPCLSCHTARSAGPSWHNL